MHLRCKIHVTNRYKTVVLVFYYRKILTFWHECYRRKMLNGEIGEQPVESLRFNICFLGVFWICNSLNSVAVWEAAEV